MVGKLMQILLTCTLLLDLRYLTSSALRVYHTVNIERSWHEAQSYCRERYTDLVTINGMEELSTILAETEDSRPYWIGLRRADGMQWHWSLSDPGFYGPGQSAYRNWSTGEPADHNSDVGNDCVHVSGGRWSSTACTNKMPFICYDVVEGKGCYSLITERKTWRDSQLYCRRNHTDLASARNRAENREIHTLANGTAAWIGLFRDPWQWSDGSSSSFRNWEPGQPAANTRSDRAYAWGGHFVTEAHEHASTHFICYSVSTGSRSVPTVSADPFVPTVSIESPIIIPTAATDSLPAVSAECPFVPGKTNQVLRLKLKVTAGDPAALTDATVREAILKQMKQKLKDKGVSGADVKLSWKTQPDGTVFHKE